MEMKELKAKSAEELKTLLGDLYREQFNLRIQRSAGQSNQTHHFKRVRREIARINLVMDNKSKGLGQ